MTSYNNNGRDSGISAYEIKENGVVVQFSTGAKYLYTYASAGNSNIEEMKKLAVRGEGLNSYINTTVKSLYERKI